MDDQGALNSIATTPGRYVAAGQARRTPSCDSTVSQRDSSLPDPANPCRFSQETLAAMDDAVTGRNLSGPYHTVKEAMGVLEEG